MAPQHPDPGATLDDARATVLADRYGRRPDRGPARSRRLPLWAVVAVVAAVALAGWAGWAAFASRMNDVRWQDGVFTRLDDGRARLVFHVTTEPGRRVVCTVRFFNEGLTEVGRVDVPAGPADTPEFDVTAVVPTFEAATSGTVRDCVLRR